MSRRLYGQLSTALRGVRDSKITPPDAEWLHGWSACCFAIKSVLAAQSSAFDSNLFLQDCGVYEPKRVGDRHFMLRTDFGDEARAALTRQDYATIEARTEMLNNSVRTQALSPVDVAPTMLAYAARFGRPATRALMRECGAMPPNARADRDVVLTDVPYGRLAEFKAKALQHLAEPQCTCGRERYIDCPVHGDHPTKGDSNAQKS